MRFIYDAEGTGYGREMAREAIRPKPPFALGDEIMLLDGLDDLGEEYPIGYNTGPAAAMTPPFNEEYDFGVDGFQLRGFELGAADYRYTGLGVGVTRPLKARAARPIAIPLNKWSTWRVRPTRPIADSPIYHYSPQMDGLGDAASDRASALAVASGIHDTCRGACGLLTSPTDRNQCLAGCDTAYAAAQTVIAAAIPAGTPPGSSTPPASADAIRAKLAQLDQTAHAAQVQAGQAPAEDHTVLYVGAAVAVVALGIGAFVLLRRA